MTEREEFEAWATTLDLDLTPIAGGHYSDCNTDFAWLAWSAARRTNPDREAIESAIREMQSAGSPYSMQRECHVFDMTMALAINILHRALKTAPNGEKK